MNQKATQNEFMRSIRIYWHNLQQLIIRPDQFYLTRKPSANWRLRLLSCLPPILLSASLFALIAGKPWLASIYIVGAYAGIGILIVMERYVLRIFDQRKSFSEMVDVVATTAPAFVLGWIPQYGVPLVCLAVGYWNWLALSRQFKLEPGPALLGTALPVVIFAGILLLGALAASWFSSVVQMFAH